MPSKHEQTNRTLLKNACKDPEAICGRQLTELGLICATIDSNLQFWTRPIDQFTSIFCDADATATGPCSYGHPQSTKHWPVYSDDTMWPSHTPFGLVSQPVTKAVRQVTQQPENLQTLSWPKHRLTLPKCSNGTRAYTTFWILRVTEYPLTVD